MTAFSDSVSGGIDGGIAVITIDSPPINAIHDSVRDGLVEAFDSYDSDPDVRAIVLRCAGRTFIAGVDIKKTQQSKGVFDYTPAIEAMERVGKPTVAALHGTALGGGLETALCCHYRIADAGARLGLPEVNLGIVPGAGGTQRLPRIAGVGTAADMITSGKPISAKDALASGLVDRVSEDDDLAAAAIAYARELVAEGAPVRRARDMAVELDLAAEEALEAARLKASKTRRGEAAPQCALDAIATGLSESFEAGVAKERELVAQCKDSPQGRGLRHLFLAEREAASIPGIDRDTPVAKVERAGVIGAGTMGRGIVVALLQAGAAVTLVDVNGEALESGMQAIAAIYDSLVKRGRLDEDGKARAMARLQGSTVLADLASADLVVEAVFEDMTLKQRIFAELDGICRGGCVLASNTSALDIDAIAAATSRPGEVIGLHFFSPAHVMRLVEVVRGERTSASTIATSLQLLKRMGKIGVVAGNCDGFVGNRMLRGYLREAGTLLLEGASPAQVDAALKNFGMPMGPFEMGDMAGMDVSAAGRKRRREEGGIPSESVEGVVADRLVALGRYGQKTGAGMYRYEDGDRTPLPDPNVQELIAEEAERLGIARREVADEEIIERCIYALVCEGYHILNEGMALRSGDIDVIYCNGYGFPRYRGGPMQYAREIGVNHVLGRIEDFQREQGDLYWRVPDAVEG